MGSNEIVQRLIALRKAKGWNRQVLAEKSGVSYKTLCNIEQGGGWSSTTMNKINEALDGAVY